MSNTLPDIILQTGVYIDVYQATGIPAGTSLVLNNKSSAFVQVQVRPSQPASNSQDGWPLRSGSVEGNWTTVRNIPAGSRVWVRGSTGGRLFVQIFED